VSGSGNTSLHAQGPRELETVARVYRAVSLTNTDVSFAGVIAVQGTHISSHTRYPLRPSFRGQGTLQPSMVGVLLRRELNGQGTLQPRIDEVPVRTRAECH
jgi:hypothetical protein